MTHSDNLKILITGASGFIGQNLIKKIKNDYQITALVRETTDLSKIPPDIQIYKFNFDINELIKKANDEKFDGIVHLASRFLKDHQANEIKDLINSNIFLGTSLLEASKKTSVKWFINTGTFWQHYNNVNYNPVNLYSATKQAFEDIAKYYVETSDLKFVTLELGDTFGPNDTRPKIFNLWEKITKTGEKLVMTKGEQIIDINYIDNVVSAYRRLIEIFETNEIDINGKNFSLKAKPRFTLIELSEIFEEVSEMKLNISWGGVDYREREVMIPWKNGEEIPGYSQKVSIAEGIKLMLNKGKSKNE